MKKNVCHVDRRAVTAPFRGTVFAGNGNGNGKGYGKEMQGKT
jgi:hypothetical protein